MSLASPDDIVAALRDYRCTVYEWAGWRTRGARSRRTGSLYPFDPYGQAWHHDAFGEGFRDLAAARYMTENGRPDLPPPLCNGAIGNFGTVYLCAYGNANHAGRNVAEVHSRLAKGLPPTGPAVGADTVVGNSRLWGWECRNAGTGRDPWEQLDVMERAGAAMCDVNGWPTAANAAHSELTARKIDPRGFSMPAFRADIARILAEHHQGDDMPLSEAEWTRLEKLLDTKLGTGSKAGQNPPAGSVLRRLFDRIKQVQDNLAESGG